MAPSAADIPSLYDVIIDGAGYRFVDAQNIDVGNYTLKHATYQFSPTFVTRQNVQGDYGDNTQDFWLTWTQRDWSLGDQSRYFRTNNGSDRRFYKGAGIDTRIAGQVTLRNAIKSLTFAGTVRTCFNAGGRLFAVSTTNLYEVDSAGTITDRGAHGAGTPGVWSLAADLGFLYIAGTTKVRKFSLAANTFADFSASLADSVCYLNNALYGYRQTNGDLVRWDTAGTISTGLQTFKNAEGSVTSQVVKMVAFGGKLLLLRTGETWGPQLWQYDGTGASQLADFPPTFSPSDMCVVAGTLFISGTFNKFNSAGTQVFRPVIFYYTQAGQSTVLWKGYDYASAAASPGMCAFDEGLAFVDSEQNKLNWFDPINGGVHGIGTVTGTGFVIECAASDSYMIVTRNGTGGFQYPDRSTVVSSATVDMSLADLDTSLTKYFKGVKVDCDIPTGATVDVSYLVDDLTGAYTSIQTGLTAGTEYAINQTGRSISIRVTLNKGSSTVGPTLKRVYVRAAPVQATFKQNEYVLDMSGRDGQQMPQLRNRQPMSKDGFSVSQAFLVSALKQAPIVIIDRFGTYNGIIDLAQTQMHEIRPEEFYTRVVVRETG